MKNLLIALFLLSAAITAVSVEDTARPLGCSTPTNSLDSSLQSSVNRWLDNQRESKKLNNKDKMIFQNG